jgi:apolipoprotein N-acyltransferase
MVWLIHSKEIPHKINRQVWLASLFYWLLTLHFVRLPFWGLWFGWLLLAGYLSVYGPLFVSFSRTLVHRFRVPTIVAVPVIFTGLEWIRVNFLTGFGIACVSHSQYQNPATMQVAEYFGAYGITFAILAVSAGAAVASSFIEKLSAGTSVNWRIVNGVVAGIAFVGVVGFGTQRLAQDSKLRNSVEHHKHLKVALIQSSIDTILKPKDLDQIEKEFVLRRDLTHSARLLANDLDLIIWPESALHQYYGDYLSDESATQTKEMMDELQFMAWRSAVGVPSPFPNAVPLLTGTTTLNPVENEFFNSAVLFDQSGTIQNRYYKNHLVMFGEYFPVVRWIPVLKNLMKGFRSLNAGSEFTQMKVGDVSISPSICFETTVPHLIRRQLNTLDLEGKEVDVLVNVTNDGWFFGTSCLDLHLACNTLRAVEMRKPVLVAANTGFSAHIDEFGRHVQVGPRREEAELICDVRVPLPKTTVYRTWGAWIAFSMGWMVIAIAVLSRLLPVKRAT